MYKRIAVVYDESTEARRALSTALPIAKALLAEVTIFVMKPHRPMYYVYAQATPGSGQTLEHDREMLQFEWLEAARKEALAAGLEAHLRLVDTDDQGNLIELLRKEGTDLLVIGLHHKGALISRLWRSVYELAEDAPCNILGVQR